MATLQALRKLIVDFKAKSGKPVYYYDDAVSGDGVVYIASAADSVFVNAEGFVGMSGSVVSKLYFKRVAEKLGIGFDIIKHGRFKSAIEPFFRDKMSDEDRLQSQPRACPVPRSCRP